MLDSYLELIATPELPGLGPESRAGCLSVDELTRRVDKWSQEQGVDAALQPSLKAGVLLWHDHLDASHQISQGISAPDGSFLHGIMHRREPDYSNAKYWFHRVGRHAAFLEIARQATALLIKESQQKLFARIITNGIWDPFAFIDVCEECFTANPASNEALLQQIQAIEFRCLMAHILQGQ